MTDLKIVGNADSGTADIVGGDDWDAMASKINTYVNSPDFANYNIYKSGSTYYAKNGLTKTIDYSGSDAATVIQNAVNASNGGVFQLGGDTNMLIQSVITIPVASNPSYKPFIFTGIEDPSRNGYGTVLRIGTSFPNNRYMFECKATTGTQRGTLILENLYFHNPQAVGLGGSDINAGFVLYEQVGNSKPGIRMRNCTIEYAWRGIHLIGLTYWNSFENIHIRDSNSAFVGECDIKMEKSTYSDIPKVSTFNGIKVLHTGKMDYSIYMEGGYNVFTDTTIDGIQYTKAPIYLLNAFSNQFHYLNLLDMNTIPSPDNRLGGNVTFDGATTYDNVIYGLKAVNYPSAVCFLNGALRNTVFIAGYYGTVPNIDDTNAGARGNTIIIQPGHLATGTATTKITTSSTNLTMVIDNRFGAVRQGTSSKNGDASTKVFTIAHGCFSTPGLFVVWPTSEEARGDFILTVDSTNIIITYPIAPPTGTGNLTYEWKAEVTYA